MYYLNGNRINKTPHKCRCPHPWRGDLLPEDNGAERKWASWIESVLCCSTESVAKIFSHNNIVHDTDWKGKSEIFLLNEDRYGSFVEQTKDPMLSKEWWITKYKIYNLGVSYLSLFSYFLQVLTGMLVTSILHSHRDLWSLGRDTMRTQMDNWTINYMSLCVFKGYWLSCYKCFLFFSNEHISPNS